MACEFNDRNPANSGVGLLDKEDAETKKRRRGETVELVGAALTSNICCRHPDLMTVTLPK